MQQTLRLAVAKKKTRLCCPKAKGDDEQAREQPRWLADAKIQFVSFVDKAANGTTFLLMQGKYDCTYIRSVDIIKSWAGEDPDGPCFVTGIVYAPNTTDTQGDAMTAEEIEEAAHWYMKNARGNDIQHNDV